MGIAEKVARIEDENKRLKAELEEANAFTNREVESLRNELEKARHAHQIEVERRTSIADELQQHLARGNKLVSIGHEGPLTSYTFENQRDQQDFRDWVVASLELENQRITQAILDGQDREERFGVGYRNCLQDVLGMLVAFGQKEGD